MEEECKIHRLLPSILRGFVRKCTSELCEGVILMYYGPFRALTAALCKNRPKVCKIKKSGKFQKNLKGSPRLGMNGKNAKNLIGFLF